MEEKDIASPFQYINESENVIKDVKEEIKEKEEQTEAFVTGLPDWDLTPPYDFIRRVSRK